MLSVFDSFPCVNRTLRSLEVWYDQCRKTDKEYACHVRVKLSQRVAVCSECDMAGLVDDYVLHTVYEGCV